MAAHWKTCFRMKPLPVCVARSHLKTVAELAELRKHHTQQCNIVSKALNRTSAEKCGGNYDFSPNKTNVGEIGYVGITLILVDFS